MNLEKCREKIDKINDEILKLFISRMEVTSQVADYKKENNLSVYQPDREREILDKIRKDAGEDMADYAGLLFSDIMALSRAYQADRNVETNIALMEKIKKAISSTPSEFPHSAVVACQGVEGAYSQLACKQIFSDPKIIYFKNFDAVFSAIEQGLCKYGILPIENSLYGSVNQVYDLMKNHNFYIARATKLKIDHTVLAKEKISLEEITDIYSHEQALGQCSEFLKEHPEIKVHVCENTAVAAKKVAESENKYAASISSPECMDIYGLSRVAKNISNSDANYTRFICISKNEEIYKDADKISLMLKTEHKPGALYRLISRFNVQGINITKLESRPIVGSEFEYMFYFDIEADITQPKVQMLISHLCKDEVNSVFLGSYREV